MIRLPLPPSSSSAPVLAPIARVLFFRAVPLSFLRPFLPSLPSDDGSTSSPICLAFFPFQNFLRRARGVNFRCDLFPYPRVSTPSYFLARSEICVSLIRGMRDRSPPLHFEDRSVAVLLRELIFRSRTRHVAMFVSDFSSPLFPRVVRTMFFYVSFPFWYTPSWSYLSWIGGASVTPWIFSDIASAFPWVFPFPFGSLGVPIHFYDSLPRNEITCTLPLYFFLSLFTLSFPRELSWYEDWTCPPISFC